MLHPTIQRLHVGRGTVHATGVFQVIHGDNWLARLAAKLARLPAASEAVAINLQVIAHDRGEEWRRDFAGRVLSSTQFRAPNGLLAERMGLLEMRFQLDVVEGALHYQTTSVAIRLGPVRITLPRWLSPRAEASEKAIDEEQLTVKVETTLPILGRLFAYAGTLRITKIEQ